MRTLCNYLHYNAECSRGKNANVIAARQEKKKKEKRREKNRRDDIIY